MNIEIFPAETATPELAASIGRLLTDLSPRFDGAPINLELLEQMIKSPTTALLLAKLDDEIVGMATLNLLIRPIGKTAFLDGFVTKKSAQGQGIGSQLWNAALDWARQNGAAKIEFTSNSSRTQAHKFYKKRGAKISPTDFFEKIL
ncbi:MAG: GNAT family N-acetyltransferase [Candidatus Nomurabacteria bacterium]|jgi:GNAT superfamily N-acetyltransferase|nr:GNAT family N-acetyltransferase [Candidatus Nomurabacteria bacterium]